MLISHEFKMIFIHVHRTGGTTIGNLLRDKMNGKLESVSQHGNAKGVEIELLRAHPGYFTFGFVRNPWDRLLSWYGRLNGPLSASPVNEERLSHFENFLTDLSESYETDPDFHFNQLDYFTDQNGRLRTTKIGRYENYESDIKDIFEIFGHELHIIPKLNTTSPKIYQDYYSERAKNLVTIKCNGDIARFGYTFE